MPMQSTFWGLLGVWDREMRKSLVGVEEMTVSEPRSISPSSRFHSAHRVDKAHSLGIFSKAIKQQRRVGGQDLCLQRIYSPGPDLSTALEKGNTGF